MLIMIMLLTAVRMSNIETPLYMPAFATATDASPASLAAPSRTLCARVLRVSIG